MSVRYLPDTNILINMVRDNAFAAYIRQHYFLYMAEPRPLHSVVSAAELRAFAARQKNWGERHFTRMEYILETFECVWIDTPEFVTAYALIDAYSLGNGRSMGKNDVWIAATANVLNAHLLTTDKDFDHLNPLFLTHTYIDPESR